MTIENQLNELIVQTETLDQTVSNELVDVNDDLSAVRSRVTALEILLGAYAADGGGLVNRVIAGNGISINPSNGKGVVTITATGTGSSTGGGSSGGGTGGGDTGGGTGGGDTGGGTTNPPPEGSYIEIVASLPTEGNFVGRTVLLNGILYIWDGTQWLTVNESLTPDAPDAVQVVSSLPTDAIDGTVVFLTTDGFLYQRVNGAWVQVVVNVSTAETVADASITVAKFAQGLRPVEILNALPTTGNIEGRLVFLTTDDKLYRYNGTQFVSSINATDLTGQIGADQIAANAITTGKIQAGAINAAQIAAGAVNTGQLAAGSITSEKIVANAVTAEKIATNAITTDKLAANSITAGKIAVGAIGASQIAAQAITSDKLATTNLITASAQIASGIITTAKIADAQITRLKIGDEAVSIVRSSTASSALNGTAAPGTFTTVQQVLSLTVTLPQAAPVLLLMALQQGYYGWDVNDPNYLGNLATYFRIRVNGVAAFERGMGAVQDTPSFSGLVNMNAGTNTVTVEWNGWYRSANAYVQLTNRNLTALVPMR